MENALILLLIVIVSNIIKWFKNKQEEAQKRNKLFSKQRSFQAPKNEDLSQEVQSFSQSKAKSIISDLGNDPVISLQEKPIQIKEEIALDFKSEIKKEELNNKQKEILPLSTSEEAIKNDISKELLVVPKNKLSHKKIRNLFLFKELIDGPVSLRKDHLEV